MVKQAETRGVMDSDSHLDNSMIPQLDPVLGTEKLTVNEAMKRNMSAESSITHALTSLNKDVNKSLRA